MPVIPTDVHVNRLARTRSRMHEHELDVLVLDADCELSANLAWRSGSDPSFEEALLFLAARRHPGDGRQVRAVP